MHRPLLGMVCSITLHLMCALWVNTVSSVAVYTKSLQWLSIQRVFSGCLYLLLSSPSRLCIQY